MADSSFKKRRPGALRIPAGHVKREEVTTALELADMLASMDHAFEPPPMSAPGGISYQEFPHTVQDILDEDSMAVEQNPDADYMMPSKTGYSQRDNLAVLTNPFMTPRERTTKASEQEWREKVSLQYSLPNSPSGDSRRNQETRLEGAFNALTLPSSGLTSPNESPRPDSDNYKEKAAARRHRRKLILAMKHNRVALSGTNAEALSALIAGREQAPEETVDKKTAAAVRNRENAFRARQTTKENLQKLKEQNSSLTKEVSDLQNENRNLKSRMEQLTQLLRQTHCGYGGMPSMNEMSHSTHSQ